MDFRTTVEVPLSPVKISLASQVFGLGSCFAEVMGEKMQQHKFETLVNPFGIIFNPVSLAKIAAILAGKDSFSEDLFTERQGQFFHFQAHSQLSASDRTALKQKLDNTVFNTQKFLQNTDFLILTLGTAFVYRHLSTQSYVANCHKMPAAWFEKKLLSVEKVLENIQNLHRNLLNSNPKIHCIFTVSPIRHTKDTLVLNQVSKSALRVACHEFCEKTENTSYFPAYEIMHDDLRDYRFYKADMIHPSETAENYIWEKFSESYFDEKTLAFLKRWKKIYVALQHKPFNIHSLDYQIFAKKLMQQLEAEQDLVNIEKELSDLQKKLS
ncbi:MAG: GSCFA domain-containing protein [Verrucomicrobia bacterium]|nr:GSCFA domain-containing protein [Cytophagales bacterium]